MDPIELLQHIKYLLTTLGTLVFACFIVLVVIAVTLRQILADQIAWNDSP